MSQKCERWEPVPVCGLMSVISRLRVILACSSLSCRTVMSSHWLQHWLKHWLQHCTLHTPHCSYTPPSTFLTHFYVILTLDTPGGPATASGGLMGWERGRVGGRRRRGNSPNKWNTYSWINSGNQDYKNFSFLISKKNSLPFSRWSAFSWSIVLVSLLSSFLQFTCHRLLFWMLTPHYIRVRL